MLEIAGKKMIKEFEFFHGVVLCKIIHHIDIDRVKTYNHNTNSSYVLNNKIGLFIKYSTKRMSPWSFCFLKEHQEEIQKMFFELKNLFILLVCNNDGVVCLNYNELKSILDEDFDETEWIRVSRKKRKQYDVSGSDGTLKFHISPGDFPKKIFDC